MRDILAQREQAERNVKYLVNTVKNFQNFLKHFADCIEPNNAEISRNSGC